MANWRNTAERWGNIARILHWTIAVLILGLIGVGAFMTDMENTPAKYQMYMLHKSTGLLVLMLVICRIVWRLSSRKPKAVPSIPWYMNAAAEVTHWGLYVLMLAIPLSGWLLHSYANFPLNWFGIEGWRVPNLVTVPVDIASARIEEIEEIHGALAWLLLFVVAVHAGAAFFHHFVRKEPILARMTPFIREPKA